MTQNIKWTASLSDGSIIYEDKGDYKRVEGELSPWLKLMEYIENNDVEITSLSLYTDDGRRWNLPSSGNPKFKELRDVGQPDGFRFFRKLSRDLVSKKEKRYAVVEAQYQDYKVQVWVRDKEPYASWSIVQ